MSHIDRKPWRKCNPEPVFDIKTPDDVVAKKLIGAIFVGCAMRAIKEEYEASARARGRKTFIESVVKRFDENVTDLPKESRCFADDLEASGLDQGQIERISGIARDVLRGVLAREFNRRAEPVKNIGEDLTPLRRCQMVAEYAGKYIFCRIKETLFPEQTLR